jgi:hypothetical protein
MNPSEPKIFGIGLSKTGTSSLDAALNELGISSIHFPCDQTTYRELSEGNYRLSILNSYRAATDISVSPFYPQLDREYPGGKFILTVRDIESWLDSVSAHWDFMWKWAPHERRFRKFLEFITACVYGAHKYHRERFIYVYQQHEKRVREYFADRPDDLLVLDICAGDGWEPLCSFLKVPVPSQPFPFANRREEKLERARWIEQLETAVREFQAVVPANHPYILIDDEQLAGSTLEDPLRARRPFEQNGLYFGPPDNSTTAIAELERLRREGVVYLVLTWPAFWWLEQYAELVPYLERFRTVWNSERLRVVELR